MNLMETAANMLGERLGIDAGSAISGLQKLFGDGGGGFDIASLIGLMQQGGLGDVVGSWLGDGANSGIDPSALISSLGADKVADAAGSMGVEPGALANGLSEVLPGLVDQASSGSSLLDSVGGLGGLAGMAKKLF